MGSDIKRLPYRGGNWNNGANAGLAAVNLNNSRVNTNTNIDIDTARLIALDFAHTFVTAVTGISGTHPYRNVMWWCLP